MIILIEQKKNLTKLSTFQDNTLSEVEIEGSLLT